MPAKIDMDPEAYERHKRDMAARSRARAAAGQEIGPLPEIKNPERRAACRDDDTLFELTYFPKRFPLAFSSAHLEMCKRMEEVIRDGGLKSIAFQRGGGKTSLAEIKVLKALLYGFRRFVVMIQATGKLAAKSLKKLKRELESNDLLLADFPEVCFPIRKLDRSPGRQRGQKLDGRSTLIDWTADGVTLPTVEGSLASGSAIYVVGITSALKGLSKLGPSGSIDRPDLFLADDAQTRGSAKSKTETDERESVLIDDVLSLSGPETAMSGIVLCTPIFEGDLSERFLSRELHPEFDPMRTKMLAALPENLAMWDQYADAMREHSLKKATEFYRENQTEMSRGAVVTWPERKKAGAYTGIDGLELAMILRCTNPSAFLAEYQCEPASRTEPNDAEAIDPRATTEKVNQVPRGVVPVDCTRLVAFMDPNQELVFFTVVGFSEQFAPSVVDYGTYPKQRSARFACKNPSPSMSDVFADRKLSLEARLYAGLSAAAEEILGRSFQRANGGEEARVELCLTDAGWGPMSDTIHQWCRNTPHKDRVKASRGRYVGAAKAPFNTWKPGPGDRRGDGWMMKAAGSKHGREVLFDANRWKTFLAERCRSPMGTIGALTWFGTNPAVHSLMGDHLAAEYPKRCESDGRVVDEWQMVPGGADNEGLDCLVGCCVAASVLGLRWDSASAAGAGAAPPVQSRPLRYADVKAGNAPPLPTPEPGMIRTKPISYAEVQRQRREGK